MLSSEQGVSYRVIRSEWHRDGSAAPSPVLRVRLLDGETPGPSVAVDAAGLALNYRLAPGSEQRPICVGRPGFRPAEAAYVDCDNAAKAGGKLCVSCSVAEATVAGSLHHAHTREQPTLDPDVAERLANPNVLYLAAFRDGSLKVGTSNASRTLVRWAEQGAWVTSALTTTADGIAVRQLEAAATETLGLAQSVSIRRKLAGMISPVDDEALAAHIDEAVPNLHAMVKALSPDLPRTDDRWRFTSDAAPSAPAQLWSRPFPYPNRLDQGNHAFTIHAMCGRLAIVTRPASQDRFVVDLGQLYGTTIELGDFEPEEVLVQDSLF